jgi:hypothetical protein
MAPRGKLEDSVAKSNIIEIRTPRDPKASCATTPRLLRYDVTLGEVKASKGCVKMGVVDGKPSLALAKCA